MPQSDDGQTAFGAASRWDKVSLAGKAALALSSTFIALGLFSIGAALPTLQGSFAQSADAGFLIQLIGSIAAPAFAVASPLVGPLVTRFGVRTVYVLSVIAFLLASAAPAASNSLVMILIFRVLLGVAVAGAFTAGMVGISRLPDRQRHGMLGLSAFLGGAISIFAYQAVGILASQSWRLAFLVAFVLAPAALLALFIPRESRQGQGAEIKVQTALPAKPNRVPVALLIVAIVIGWTMVASSIYSPFFLASLGVTDPATMGSILAVLAFGSLAGSGCYGFLQKHWGTAGIMQAGLVLCAVGCGVFSLSSGQTIATIGLGLTGLGMGASGTAIYAMALEAVGAEGDSGAATGIVSLALYLPQILFPLAAGVLAASFGPSIVYVVMVGLLIAAMVVLVTRSQPKSAEGH